MKTAFISDLHIDINKDYPVLEATADAALLAAAQILVVAGDISETPALTLSAMDRLRTLCPCPVYYVPGNHDMWNKNCPDTDTESIYAAYINDSKCLSGKHIFLSGDSGEIALTGDIGWYDYSFASSEYSETDLNRMSINGRTWQDHFFNQWTKDNRKQMSLGLARLKSQLKACGNTPILAVTHMLPVNDFCVPETQKDWGYFNAYLGSSALEELYRNYPVRWAVCGHVHYRRQMTKNGIRYICPCLGYYNEWPLYGPGDDSLQKQIKDAMVILEI